MTPEQAAAFVIAQAACATAEVAAMQRTNDDHLRATPNAVFPPYSADDFRAVADRFGIGHNSVLQTFQDANR
jgi:hypothetical protein